jgi:hypothetical protein
VAIFTVSLSDPSDKEVTVNFSTADGTATIGDGDYAATSGALTFTPGTLTQTIAVTLFGDTRDELDDSFFVNLSGATNATIADAQGVGTIGQRRDRREHQQPDGAGRRQWHRRGSLRRDALRPAHAGGDGEFRTQDGTATVADGITRRAAARSLSPRARRARRSVCRCSGDTKAEANEAFSVLLSDAQNATVVGSGSGTATITNDDVVVDHGPGSHDRGRGQRHAERALYGAALEASATEVTVNFATQDGTATRARITSPRTGVLTSRLGQVEKTISVPVIGDWPRNLMRLSRSSSVKRTGATIGDGTAVGNDPRCAHDLDR